jgi:tight adherence protein B
MAVIIAAALASSAAWLLVRPSLRTSSPVPMVRQWIGRARHRLLTRRHRAQRRSAMREALAEVVADMRAGQPPSRALERALSDRDDDLATRTLAASRWGGDVVEALREDSRASSLPILAAAAACWSVAANQGAGLADALDRLVAQDRRAEEVRRQLDAHLAAPRATARMLALLPALGIVLGLAVGGDPIGWLVGTPLGWACLGLGLLLIAAGLAWASRIVARTERLL